MIHKTAVTILLGALTPAFAGTMGPICSPKNVTIPCEKNAWEFGLEALYLKASTNKDFLYAGTNAQTTTTNISSSQSIIQIDDRYIPRQFDWGFGFKAQGAYYFNEGSDINLNWLHYQKNSSQTSVTSLGSIVGSVPNHFEISPRFNAVNLEWGQHMNIGDNASLRYYLAAQYAQLKTSLNLKAPDFNSQNVGLVTNVKTSDSLKFNGIGPRFGAHLAYGSWHHVSVYGDTAATFLIGKYQFFSSGSQEFGSTKRTLTLSHFNGSASSRLVPELEAQLGLTYAYPLQSGNLSINIGYMWLNYFEMIQKLNQSSDFGLNGAVLGLKWVG